MVQDAVAQAAQEGHLAQPRGWGARGSLGEGFIEAKRLELRVKGKQARVLRTPPVGPSLERSRSLWMVCGSAELKVRECAGVWERVRKRQAGARWGRPALCPDQECPG